MQGSMHLFTKACGIQYLQRCHFLFLGEVRMPSGKTARPHITDNKDGTVTVKYAPTEKGLHEMDIKYDRNHIPGIKTIRCLLL